MFSTLARLVTACATATMLAATLGGCGSDEEPAPGTKATARSAPTTGGTAKAGFQADDVPDPGEDLLDHIRKGSTFPGAMLKASWKFPESFESEPLVTTSAYSKDEHFRIKLLSRQGDQAQAAAVMEDTQRQATAKGQKTSLDTVTVAGMKFAVLVQDTPEAGILSYAHAPEGSQQFFIVQFASDMNLADVPQEQLDAFLQTVGSLEFEPA